ncbi:prolyl oligopeptidase family serine peptidase [Companilactobacillus musae]|uniref:prolyl oligopeptidase family serine peptidase n=1 Tax=Companilactobacillus musae TaxID=1903258 RepID=UPI000E64B281|nr:prolyl oligopeptidase family serine peptidase [Companilactobacillus musae]
MTNKILYIHGMGGDVTEAQRFEENCPNYDIMGVDYNEYLPWVVAKKIRAYYDEVKDDPVAIIANSIGAYFSMLALQDQSLQQALFISPLLDMEQYILSKMQQAGITENELQAKGEIETDRKEILSWQYLQYVREHPLDWKVPTEILYGEKDDRIPLVTVKKFVKEHRAGLTIMPEGEHRFHTRVQLNFLNEWMKKVIK